MLSRDDILQYIVDGDLAIYPFDQKNLTGIGYNLSVTNFAFSINRGILLTIYSKITPAGAKHYVIIPANDTVLFFSKEYIRVSNKLAGTFHSKVGRVCQGLGHISTTLDPTWKGQLIISVNNPTSKNIKFDLDERSGNILTLLLYKFDTPVEGENIHDNNSGRCDLLLEHFSDSCKGQYKEKHLELKEYITNDFSKSLNGDDNFLDQKINDEYASKVTQLFELRNRLKKDFMIIRENRYKLGPEGRYYPLENEKEHLLLQNCVLFNIWDIIENNHRKSHIPSANLQNCSTSLLTQESFSDDEQENIKKALSECLKAIDYELEIINHIRRIRWQNSKALQFASAESELVIMRKKAETQKFYKNIFALLLIAISLVCLFIAAITNLDLSTQFTTVLAPCVIAIVTLLIQEIARLIKQRSK